MTREIITRTIIDLNQSMKKDQIFQVNLGIFMRNVRLKKRKTQTDVAEKIQVTFQQVQKYECGMNTIGIINLHKFCVLTDSDINTFFEDLTKYDAKLEDHREE